MAVHSIVILGAGFAGLGSAQYLLRHTIPALEAKDPNQTTTYKVTIVTPSTHFFWKIASPRALLGKADLLPIDKCFLPVEDGFKDYPKDKFNFIYGAAVGCDETQKILKIQSKGEPEMPLKYDTLVLAAGSRSSTPIWSLFGGHEESEKALEEMAGLLRNAKSVVIGGGGASGVETSGKCTSAQDGACCGVANNCVPKGEIIAAYPSMDLTLLSGNKQLLPRLSNKKVGQAAENRLKGLNVKVVNNLRVTSTQQSGSQTALTMSDGSKMRADVYIDSTGSKPNTGFLPRAWLNDSGYVKTNETTLRGPVESVYAIGDNASYSLGGFPDVMYAVRPLCSTILMDLTGKLGAQETTTEKPIPYKQITKDMQLIPLGPKIGVGVFMGWRIPSFLVWLVKSRTFMIEKAEGMVKGADYVKA